MTVEVITLPRLTQIYADALSTPVAICSSGAMRGEKCGGGQCTPPAPGH